MSFFSLCLRVQVRHHSSSADHLPRKGATASNRAGVRICALTIINPALPMRLEDETPDGVAAMTSETKNPPERVRRPRWLYDASTNPAQVREGARVMPPGDRQRDLEQIRLLEAALRRR
jgi:hypothetical protein